MPAFRFVITHKDKRTEEACELELADITTAWAEATITAGQMLRDCDGSFKPFSEFGVQVQDVSGNALRTIRIIAVNHE